MDQCPEVNAILGLESRGFLFGPILASELKLPFIPIRKKGKLPGEVQSISYALEYGEVIIEKEFCFKIITHLWYF